MTDQPLPGDSSLPSSQQELEELIKAGEQTNFKYSVEDFFRKPEKTGFQISHDGKYFSYLSPYERRQNIFVQKIGEEESMRITSETQRDIAGYFWANSGRIVYIKDQAGDENFKLYAVDADGSNPKDLTPFDGVRIDLIDDLEDHHDEVIIAMNKNNPQLFEPYRLNIYSGGLNQLAKNDNPLEPIDQWITDHDGNLRMATQIVDGVNARLLYRDTEESNFEEIITISFKESLTPLFFDFDNGSKVFMSSNLGRDKSVITTWDMHTKKETGEIIFQHDEVDVDGLMFSKKRKVLTGIHFTTDKLHYHFLDDQRKIMQQRLEEELSGYDVMVADSDKAEKLYLVRTYSDKSLGSYYLYDLDKDLLTHLVDISPWIEEKDMIPMKPITYASRDRLTIHGYLSLPANPTKGAVPLVVNPHGGPWVRDTWGYNPEVQLLTSRGYAVLQMNYRGSTGYGRAFWEASFKQWGKAMQDDITDGVNYLIDQGIVDPDRVAIYGGSYGGYATLAGVTFTPALYACAIDYVGVANLFTFMNTIPPYWKPYLQMMYAMVGDPEKDKELMMEASPVYHVDKIKAPLFIIQGANDPRVNIDESDQIVRSLRERGIEVPYMVKYDEGHGFHNEENQFEVYKAMVGFLSKYL